MSKSTDFLWYRNAIIYQIFVATFKDSNGDGYGDLQGVIQSLDYLKGLGVDAIYLNPIFKANKESDFTRSDLGYEVLDLFAVDPDYGSLEDFKELVQSLHDRNMKIILDFITAGLHVQHPIFQAALLNDSRYHDWFIIRDNIPEGAWSNYGGNAWNKLPNGKYYYALFGTLPYFNLASDTAQTYLLDVAAFWLELGVDGFRIDSAKSLATQGPGAQAHQPLGLQFIQRFEAMLQTFSHPKLLVLELIPEPLKLAYVGPNRPTAYWTDHFKIHFGGVNFKSEICREMSNIPSSYLEGFYRNGTNYSINAISHHDIGRMIATLETGEHEERLKKCLAQLLLLNNGACQIYYGDEIGLLGIATPESNPFNHYSHHHITSMAWDTSDFGGFSAVTPKIPMSSDYLFHNVAAELKSKSSLLNHYRILIKLRQQYPLIGLGTRLPYPTKNTHIQSFILFDSDHIVVILHNIEHTTQTSRLDLKTSGLDSGGEIIFGKDSSKVNFTSDWAEVTLSGMSSACLYFNVTDSFLNWVKQEHGCYLEQDDDSSRLITIDRTAGPCYIHFTKNLPKYIFCKYPTRWVRHEMSQTDFYVDDITDVLYLSTAAPYQVRPLNWLDLFKKSHCIAQSSHNQSLKKLFATEIDSAYYFKVDIDKIILAQENGGIDLVLFMSNPDMEGAYEIEFYGFPSLSVEKSVQYILTFSFERGVPLLYDIRVGIQPGLAIGPVIFHRERNSCYFIIQKKVLTTKPYFLSAFCWSIGMGYGASENRAAGVVEQLPEKQITSRLGWAQVMDHQ